MVSIEQNLVELCVRSNCYNPVHGLITRNQCHFCGAINMYIIDPNMWVHRLTKYEVPARLFYPVSIYAFHHYVFCYNYGQARCCNCYCCHHNLNRWKNNQRVLEASCSITWISKAITIIIVLYVSPKSLSTMSSQSLSNSSQTSVADGLSAFPSSQSPISSCNRLPLRNSVWFLFLNHSHRHLHPSTTF